MQTVSGLSRRLRAGCEAAKGQIVYSLYTGQFHYGIRQCTLRRAKGDVPSLWSNFDAVGGKLAIVADIPEGGVAITSFSDVRPLRNLEVVARKTLTPTLSHGEREQEPSLSRWRGAFCKGLEVGEQVS